MLLSVEVLGVVAGVLLSVAAGMLVSVEGVAAGVSEGSGGGVGVVVALGVVVGLGGVALLVEAAKASDARPRPNVRIAIVFFMLLVSTELIFTKKHTATISLGPSVLQVLFSQGK